VRNGNETPRSLDSRYGDPSRRLKIGEVAKRTGVGIETLRFYERQGLLGHPARTESGYRLYDESVVEQLEFIR
jgi:DNA-binding transcriptional MerR regulator